MARHAIVNNTTKTVVNCIEWDGNEWLPPRDHLVIQSETANIGDIYDEISKQFQNTTSNNVPVIDQSH